MSYLAMFVLTFMLVAVKAFQQINVIRGHWLRIIPTSYIFAMCTLGEIYFGVNVVMGELEFLPSALAMGTAGWSGSHFSMWVQGRLG